MSNPFDDLLSLSEASKIYDIDDSSIRHSISRNNFEVGVEVKKFGKQWVITKQALDKRYKKR